MTTYVLLSGGRPGQARAGALALGPGLDLDAKPPWIPSLFTNHGGTQQQMA